MPATLHPHRQSFLYALCIGLSLTTTSTIFGDDDFERPPINYSEATPANRVSALQARMDAGEFTLNYTADQGYLADVLRGLDVPVDSQVLVFSKTSLQMRRISPQTPRALYFNDDVYVGFCQSGDVVEVSVADPQLGAVFYTVNQDASEAPRFERRTENCLVCHSSSRTGGVPGHLVRSLYVDAGGTPILSSGSRIVDHKTPLETRWGGWYVTGTHGSQKHLGNLIIPGRRVSEPVDNSAGQNVRKLDDFIAVDRYLSPHSDIVSLMVLEHQTLVHNRITKASFSTRQALEYEKMMNRMLENPPGTRLDSTTRRIHNACDDLVEALLLVDEAKLTEPIHGTSGFEKTFPQSGPRDKAGRSLRDLDLKTRLFVYPCSYLIYSDPFNALPDEAKNYVWERLWEILSGQDQSKQFAHLTASDRQAIVEILRDTRTDLPSSWYADTAQIQPDSRTD